MFGTGKKTARWVNEGIEQYFGVFMFVAASNLKCFFANQTELMAILVVLLLDTVRYLSVTSFWVVASAIAYT